MSSVEQIRIPLKHLGYTIAVSIRKDCDAEDTMVVFAHPEKLKPYMDKINARESTRHIAGIKREALLGFEIARITEGLHASRNPLPMGWAHCHLLGTTQTIAFTDGVGRTTELIDQGAKIIPLQASHNEAEILHRLVGSDRAPVPASDYLRPHDFRSEEGITLTHNPQDCRM